VAVEYASFWRRFGAHLIDGLILNVVLILVSLIFVVGPGIVGLVEPSILSVVGWLISVAIPIAYCVWFWTKTGSTPGKVALGIRVVAQGGGSMSKSRSFVRYLGYIVSSLVFGLGFLAMLWDSESRCWHDRMADTRVIRI
jgi:uncharacterized RDD family membrane protein YckC